MNSHLYGLKRVQFEEERFILRPTSSNNVEAPRVRAMKRFKRTDKFNLLNYTFYPRIINSSV